MRSKVLALTAVVVATTSLAACGDGSGTADSPTPTRIPATNYVTIAPATTTTTLPGQTTLPSEERQGEQSYTVVAGDYALKVAKLFNVTLTALVEANGWKANASDFPPPGTVIRIPAGGTLPGVATTVAGQPAQTTQPGQTTTSARPAGATTTTKAPTTTIKGGTSNCPEGEYKLVDGDTPSGVAKKFGTTVEALNAANVNTKYYSSFAVGITIKIPAKTAC